MAKIRIYELAKSLEKDSKEIIEILKKNGVEVKNHMSSVTEEEAQKVRDRFSGKKAVKEEAAKAGTAKPAAKPEAVKSAAKAETAKPAAKPEAAKPVAKAETAKPAAKTEAATSAAKAEPVRPVAKAEPARRPEGGVSQNPVRREGERRPQAGSGVRREDGRPQAGGLHREGERRPQAGGVRREDGRPQAGGMRREDGRPQAGGVRREDGRSQAGGMRREGERRPQAGGMRREGERRPQGDRREFGGPRREGERRPQGDRREFGGPRREGDRNGRPQGERRDFGGNRNGRRDDRREEKLSISAPMDRASIDRDRMDRHKDKDRKEREKNSLYEDGDSRKKNRRKDEHFTVKGTKPVKKPVVKQKPKEPEEPVIRTIELPETLTVQELADKIKTPVSQLIKKLFLAGEMVTVNTDLDFEKAAEIALEYNCIAEEEVKVDVIEEMLKEEEEDEALLKERPPVVCVMGHVDHGKTSLLDAIRETSVTSAEAGGITQHIGAYTVEANGQQITFLDTPGHEAFTAMRMRGAQSTDIAILVVAADDGVMPQTVEAINHAKAAGIEIIVAVNKIDKESANVERVKQELVEYELIAEDWGGSTVFCPVSAHTKEGIDNLLEMILLTAEVLELKANPNRKARGIVIEAELDKGRGPVATMLVQKGTLKVGDTIAVGSSYGRVRAMVNDKGQNVKEAGPSQPVEILGLNGVPAAGEIFVATKNEKEARSMAETYIACDKEKLLAETKSKMSLDDLFSQIQAGNVKELNLVVKADVQGSVEAVKQSLLKLSNEEVVIKVIHAGVGAINESDVILASASNAIIIGFNVRPDVQAKSVAEREKVDLRLYKVIYNAIEDIEAAMKGMLDPVYEEQITGHLVVRQTFKASGVGTIAGSFVLDGLIKRSSSVRVTRDGEQIFDGPLASLKRFKDDVKEVKNGFECGIVLEDFNDLKEDDQLEAYEMVEVPR